MHIANCKHAFVLGPRMQWEMHHVDPCENRVVGVLMDCRLTARYPLKPSIAPSI